MSHSPLSLTSLLDSLDDEVNTVLNNSQVNVIERGEDFKIADTPTSSSDTWIKLSDVVAVVCDLKGSTHLGTGKHDQSTQYPWGEVQGREVLLDVDVDHLVDRPADRLRAHALLRILVGIVWSWVVRQPSRSRK